MAPASKKTPAWGRGSVYGSTRRLLLYTLRRVPNLRRSFDAGFLHRALQLRRCGKRLSLLEAVEVMSYRDIIWIVDRLVNGLGNDAHFLLRRAKPIVRLLPCGVIRDFVTNKHVHIRRERWSGHAENSERQQAGGHI